MQNEFLEMVNKFNENAFASAKRLGDLNLRTFEQIAGKQSEIMNSCMESSAKQYEILSTTKDYKQAMAAQSELLQQCSEKFMANVRETAEMMAEFREELTRMAEEAARFASESVEKAGELASKKVV
jgi:phasin family protein